MRTVLKEVDYYGSYVKRPMRNRSDPEACEVSIVIWAVQSILTSKYERCALDVVKSCTLDRVVETQTPRQRTPFEVLLLLID